MKRKLFAISILLVLITCLFIYLNDNKYKLGLYDGDYSDYYPITLDGSPKLYIPKEFETLVPKPTDIQDKEPLGSFSDKENRLIKIDKFHNIDLAKTVDQYFTSQVKGQQIIEFINSKVKISGFPYYSKMDFEIGSKIDGQEYILLSNYEDDIKFAIMRGNLDEIIVISFYCTEPMDKKIEKIITSLEI